VNVGVGEVEGGAALVTPPPPREASAAQAASSKPIINRFIILGVSQV
jgi:hypothetical protein